MHKRLQHANLSALCDPASLIAVAKYILEHLCNQMKNECIPSFSLALLRCLDDPDDANNAESAFEAVNDMAGNLSAHLQAIDVVTSQLRPHVQSDAPASSLSKVVLLHHTYLSAVSAMLQTSVKADLQKVRSQEYGIFRLSTIFSIAFSSELCAGPGRVLFRSAS